MKLAVILASLMALSGSHALDYVTDFQCGTKNDPIPLIANEVNTIRFRFDPTSNPDSDSVKSLVLRDITADFPDEWLIRPVRAQTSQDEGGATILELEIEPKYPEYGSNYEPWMIGSYSVNVGDAQRVEAAQNQPRSFWSYFWNRNGQPLKMDHFSCEQSYFQLKRRSRRASSHRYKPY